MIIEKFYFERNGRNIPGFQHIASKIRDLLYPLKKLSSEKN